MEALGLGTVPVTIIGDTVVVGLNRAELVRALSLRPQDQTPVNAQSLSAQFERALGAFLRASRQVPDAKLNWKSPERDRSLRAFIYHVFDRPNLVLVATETGLYRYEDILQSYENAQECATTAALVSYGEAVLDRLRRYLGAASEKELSFQIDSYQGTMAVLDLLNLAVGHTVHHLKQLYHYFGQMGLTPEFALSDSDLAGIKTPSELF